MLQVPLTHVVRLTHLIEGEFTLIYLLLSYAHQNFGGERGGGVVGSIFMKRTKLNIDL